MMPRGIPLYLSLSAPIILGAFFVLGASCLQAIFDYARPSVKTSEVSRWYSLIELDLGSFPSLIEVGLKKIEVDNVASTGLGLFAPCSESIPLSSRRIRTVLRNTENWEGGIETGSDVVGFPSVVRNTNGKNPDYKFYLFYAIHQAHSGIGLTISDNLDSEFVKLADKSVWEIDSRVLRAPRRPHKTSHFSSPVVIWNPDEKLWFMYFHYYVNEWNRGLGHQKTALATTDDLARGRWSLWTDAQGQLIAVLPVTAARWMNSQSSYHSIYRLPNGLWIAFIRGVGGDYDGHAGAWQQDAAKLGFALSRDGRRWAEVPGNPVLHQTDGRGGRTGVYRPKFMGKYGDQLLLCWSESDYYDSNAELRCGVTQDLKSIKPIALPFSNWQPADGPTSVWSTPESLYLFDGQVAREFSYPRNCRPDGTLH